MKASQVRLLVDDFGAAFRFYRDALGFEGAFGDWGGRVAYLRDPAGNLIELVQALPPPE